MKPFGFRQVMKTIAKANYIKKGLTPFEMHHYIEPEDWKEFVQMCESEEAVIESERYNLLREQYKQEHCMGPSGYEGIQAQWDEEDRKLASIGIANPYEEFSKGRTRSCCEQGVSW